MGILKRKTLFLATLTALSCVGAAGFCTQKNAPVSANADEYSLQLISPSDYRQYLPLIAPTDVAVTKEFTAIADGNTIYLYEGDITDTTVGAYRTYTHQNPIEQLAFDGQGNLYFLSEFMLYRLSTADLQTSATAEPLNVVCSHFALNGDTLYYYAMSKTAIKRYSLTNNQAMDDISLPYPLQDNSPLIFIGGKLHYVGNNGNGYTVCAISNGKNEEIATFTEPLKSFSVANHLFGAVMESGAFFTYNYSDLQGKSTEGVPPVTQTEADGYTAVTTHDGDFFAIQGNAVKRYSSSSAAFESFEISSASSSTNRLDGANEVYLADGKLFIADNGNDRISVYNTDTDTFETAVSTTLQNPFITSYKDTLFAASEQEAAIYSLSSEGYGEAVYTLSVDEADGQIVGAASVYDTYYLLTNKSYCYAFTVNGSVWNYTKAQNLPISQSNATAFASDVYGSLYIAYDDGNLYRYTEQEFLSAAAGENLQISTTAVQKIAVDFSGNLYALSNGSVYKYTQNAEGRYELNATFTPNYGLVKDDNPVLKSFAFGVDTPDMYLLYEGNYLVKSDELPIATVNTIAVSEEAQIIFLPDQRSFAMVEVTADSVLTEFDLNALQGATTFPYLAFERNEAPFTALKIGETEEGKYSIIVVTSGETAYKTYLVETANCVVLSEESYRTPAEKETGYLTSNVLLYKYPYLNEILTVTELPRGEKVTLLGKVKHLDRVYYELSYTNDQGETVTGFVPEAYINLFDGSAPIVQTETYGDTEDDMDAVFRMAYLLLGLGAIGILLDVLLLRKPKDTDED